MDRQVSPAFSRARSPESDPEVMAAVTAELERQQNQIELIASENIVSRAVLEAVGSVLTNKYAEGYPGRRYYGGCEYVDVAEALAIERAEKLFGCEYANVQPHAGAQANAAVFLALLQPGRYLHGHGPGGGRSSDPRLKGKCLRQVVQRRFLWCSQGNARHRFRPSREAGS